MATDHSIESTDSIAEQRLKSLGYQQELKRTMSLGDVVVYGLIFMCPLAPVSVFGYIYNLSGGMVAAVYIVAAIAMYFSAISYSEMAKQFPVAGSVYSYVRFGGGEFIGFVSGWAILLDYLLLPALLLIFASAAMHLQVPAIPQLGWVIIFVLVATIVNLRGITFTAKTNLVCLYIQLAVMLMFAVAVLRAIQLGVVHFSFDPLLQKDLLSIHTIFAAIPIAALSYVGFDAISTLNEEARGGGKTVSTATMIVLIVVAALFVTQVYLAALFLPTGTKIGAGKVDTAFYDIAVTAAGAWFKPVITIATAVIALLANSLVSQATTARLIFSMARDRQLPAALAVVDAKTKVPVRAILLVASLSLLLGIVTVDKADLVTSLVTFGALTAYSLLHLSVLRYFSSQGAARRMFKHVISPLIGLTLLGYALWSAPVHAKLLAAIWLVIGLILFKTRKSLLGGLTHT